MVTSPWIPVEWIAAHGLAPRGAWGVPGTSDGALVEGICPIAQAMLDLGRMPAEAAILFTTACDPMRRAYDQLAGQPRRPAFLFNLPATWQTPAARQTYHAEVLRLGRFLERLGGTAPSPERLSAVMQSFQEQRACLRDYIREHPGRCAAEALAAFFQAGSFQPAPAIAQRPASSMVPVAVLGGATLAAEYGLFDALEAVGAQVVLNGLEPGERCLLPPYPVADEFAPPVDRLVDHYFRHQVDAFRRPNRQLYDWLARGKVERGFRALILFTRVGCDLWRAEAESMREALGVPVLTIDMPIVPGVGFSPREITRLAALLESLA